MDSNPCIDFTSESFDAAQALASKAVVLPYPKAKTYNNIAEYHSHTFMKKNMADIKKKLTPKDRNYAYYLNTIGIRGQRASYYLESLKRIRNAKKGVRKKKPVNITYTPGSPLRSEKVIPLEKKFPQYWKKKQLLYKKAEALSDITSILKKSDDIPLFQKIKSLAKPLTAQELIERALQPTPSNVQQTPSNVQPTPSNATGMCTADCRPYSESCRNPESSSTATLADYLSDYSSTEELEPCCSSTWIVTNPRKKKVNKQRHFLAQRNPNNKLEFNSRRMYTSPFTPKLNNVLPKSAQNFKPKPIVVVNPINYKGIASKVISDVGVTSKLNSNYSKCAQRLEVADSAPTALNQTNCKVVDFQVTSSKSDTQNAEDNEIDSTLSSKENILGSTEEVTLSDCKTKRKVKLIRPRIKTPKKENLKVLTKTCICNPKVSIESECTCGFYSTAMSNIRKFKIPRKKPVNMQK